MKISQYIINNKYYQSMQFFFFFIGWEPTMWPANNRLQIMVCSCPVLSSPVCLQIILCSCVNKATLFSFLFLLREMADCIASRRYSLKNKLGDWMTKQLLNLVITKYCDLSVCHRSILFDASCYWQIPLFRSTSSNNC